MLVWLCFILISKQATGFFLFFFYILFYFNLTKTKQKIYFEKPLEDFI